MFSATSAVNVISSLGANWTVSKPLVRSRLSSLNPTPRLVGRYTNWPSLGALTIVAPSTIPKFFKLSALVLSQVRKLKSSTLAWRLPESRSWKLPNTETPKVALSLVQLYKPLTSGVMSSPLVSFTALTPRLTWVPSDSRGLMVSTLIVAPTPPVAIDERPVL